MDEARGKILIVDDEESIRSILTRKLKADGYDCMVASDGEEAAESVSTEDFDLVLMDIKMPGKSGVEILSWMAADHPDTSVIMITALADAQIAIESMKMGACDYVTKPFNLDALSMKIDRALEKRRLIIENKEYQLRLEEKVEHQEEQMQQYYRKAIQAFAREELALEVLDATRHTGRKDASDGEVGAAHSRESSSPVREFVRRKSQLPDIERERGFEIVLQMARMLALTAETREPYARGHSERVTMLANEIAAQLGCSVEMMRDIELAAIVHDAGKIVIPDNILFKPGHLTPAEYNEIKRHPAATVDIIRHSEYFKDILPLVEGHHEWYNGKGYPNRLKGENIPMGARILAVADAYDAMTCPRPHRPRLSNEEAIQVLRKGAKKQWAPDVVDALLNVLERESRMLHDPTVEN